MGRPYASELAELTQTYAWCRSAPVEELADSVARFAGKPLISIGSGGSLSSAAFAAYLHARHASALAHCSTPYEVLASPIHLGSLAVLVCTAGGSNPDVLACVRAILARSPAEFGAICTKVGTPLAKVLAPNGWAKCHEFATPIKKDGFLATNSLLASCILLTRAYEQAYSLTPSLADSLDQLLSPGGTRDDFIEQLQANLDPLWDRQTLVVLHGHATAPAALDIESRFTEAALGNVQVADYRNFAHGRHHWLAKYGDRTSVLILSSTDERRIAARTAKLIPADIPKAELVFVTGPSGAIAAVVNSIYLAWLKANASGVDPGRPSIPDFGRQLYHLNPAPSLRKRDLHDERMHAAIELKTGKSISTLRATGLLDRWIEHYGRFADRLQTTEFDAVVLDYDGTLCGHIDRFGSPRADVISLIRSILKAGLTIGIATGRGRSVRDALLPLVKNPRWRDRVIIAYHNGGEIGLLGDVATPPLESPLDSRLIAIRDRLLASDFIREHTTVTAKGAQITLEWKSCGFASQAYDLIHSIVRRSGTPDLSVVTSTHSIDVLAPGISKVALLSHIRKALDVKGKKGAMLCIGDRGRWPGNDADLLTQEVSLSVDEVSQDPLSCWNIATPGQRNVEACIEYLSSLKCRAGVGRYEF